MKTIIATTVLLFMSASVVAEVIDKPLADITTMVTAGQVDQLVVEGVPVTGARYSAQMETISADLGIDIYASVDTDYVLWFAPKNGAGSALDRLK